MAEAQDWERRHTTFPPNVEAYLARINAVPGLSFANNVLGPIGGDNERRMASSSVSHAIRIIDEVERISKGKPIEPDPRIDHVRFHAHQLAAHETAGRMVAALLTTPLGRQALEELTAAGKREVKDIPLK